MREATTWPALGLIQINAGLLFVVKNSALGRSKSRKVQEMTTPASHTSKQPAQRQAKTAQVAPQPKRKLSVRLKVIRQPVAPGAFDC